MRIIQVPTIATALNASNVLPGFNYTATIPGNVTHTSSAAAEITVIANGTDISAVFDPSNSQFPPRSWLGFGIDMTTVTPLDVTSVASSVLTHTRLIELGKGGEEQEFSGIRWLVPPGVDVNQDMNVGSSSYSSFKSGEQAADAITLDATLSARYMAIQGDVSASYAIKKAFQKSYQYAMFSYNQLMLRVGFEDYGDQVNESFLRLRMSRIAKFNPRDPAVIEQYRSLFATIGSHTIVSVNYGGRLQLNVWAENSDADVDREFSVDIAAEFNGLTTGGKVDASVKTEPQYQTFEESVQKTSSCLGGNPKLASNIGSNPSRDGVFETYQSWVETAQTKPNIMGFQVMALWDLMLSAHSTAVAQRGPDVYQAYQWIVENPEEHQTKARLDITSDWGEIGLLTPSAYIMRDPQQADIPGAVFSSTKVTWTSGGGVGRDITIDFIIVNDGSPVDIELSHGSNGSSGGAGRITAEFAGKAYTNDIVRDNNWNTQRYMSCPVDPHGRPLPNAAENVATA